MSFSAQWAIQGVSVLENIQDFLVIQRLKLPEEVFL